MDDQIINKLIARMVEIFATKDDLKKFATKDDFNNLKSDVSVLKSDVSVLKSEIKRVEQNLTNEIRSIGKALSDSTDELDKVTQNHEKRLKKIESIPSIAPQIK